MLKTAKEEIREILSRLPGNSSFGDIQHHIYVCQKVAEGLEDASGGRTLSQAQAEERLARGLGK